MQKRVIGGFIILGLIMLLSFSFVSAGFLGWLEKITGNFNGITGNAKLGDFITALGGAVQTGAQLYTNYVDAVSVLHGVGDCIDSYKKFLDYQKGPSSHIANTLNANDVLAKYALDITQAREAEDFIEQADRVINDISNTLIDRIKNPDLEPLFNSSVLPTSSTLPTDQSQPVTEKPIFRLVFGPPKSKVGQFLLSVDGLYYDSQTGGLPNVSGVIPSQDKFKFNFAPNLGGKGESISNKDLDKFVDTIFDPNTIDDSIEIQRHYDADHFLQVLLSQKHRNIYDLSGQIHRLQASGYSEDSAMMSNMRQQLYSVAAQHNVKVNKRKKQLEVAVKAPSLFGAGKVFKFGEIPINDFSYLANLNLAVAYDRQRKLIFRQGEVSGIILPIQPKFVKASEAESVVTFNHLLVPPVGAGSIIFETSGGQPQNVLSLTDSIITDGLIAVYNFLESDISSPGSNEFNALNCIAKTNKDKSAQLVGANASSIFSSGLGIPYLYGMVKLSNSTGYPSGLGSYIQLPQIQDFQNLFYSPKGMTFESWVYMPGLTTSSTLLEASGTEWATSSFHRTLLACENTGGANNNESVNNIQIDYGSDYVRGLVCGFTRDAQIVSNLAPNDNNDANPVVASGIHFYMAPTRSFNGSDIGFLRDTVTVDCGTNTYKTLKCSIPITTSVNNKNFGQVSSTFCQVVITVQPEANELKFYLDGSLMVTSSLDQVFGIKPYSTVKIPSFIQSNSFGYSTSSTGLSLFANGPTVSSFTPWVIGGGFTDGMYQSNGFMGQNNGLSSGLKGHIGSIKFYSKPLNNSEVLTNFNGQQAFFKNILL